MADFPLAFSFDDILLVPARSAILPADAAIDTMLSKDISLRIPVVSAAMDTVSESELAIALAREA
jgi:IMP dehydrogenase